MRIEKCSHQDYLQIVEHLDEFWDSDRTIEFHHPIFIHEFRNTSFVIKEEDRVVAYLFGFHAQVGEMGYIHLAATRKDFRDQGYARALYEHFFSILSESGNVKVKVITSPQNSGSIAFHEHLGFNIIELAKNYAGPGLDRVILEKAL